jgi:hypothetical protein
MVTKKPKICKAEIHQPLKFIVMEMEKNEIKLWSTMLLNFKLRSECYSQEFVVVPAYTVHPRNHGLRFVLAMGFMHEPGSKYPKVRDSHFES